MGASVVEPGHWLHASPVQHGPEDLSMNAVLRHVGQLQAMHEANDLVPPSIHPWHLRQLPENDCRGDTPLEAAELPEEGYLDISHLLDVTRQGLGARRAPNLKGPQTSEPYETVGKTKASNKRLIMGKDF